MKTYSELFLEFSSRNSESKLKWIDGLIIDELKILRNGLEPHMGHYGSWVQYIDTIILEKIGKEREDKLNGLEIDR